MGLVLLTERHADQIAGVLSCYDRMLVFGTLPGVCFAEGMTSYLYARKVRIFYYPRFAEPFRNELRENAERLAAESGFTRSSSGRSGSPVTPILCAASISSTRVPPQGPRNPDLIAGLKAII